MPKMVKFGSELIRLNTARNFLESSTNNGRTWIMRYSGSSCGIFFDLLSFGNEIIAVTNKGIYYSTNSGRTWISRYTGSSCGQFLTLTDGGNEVLCETTKGLYYSTNSGRTWIKRR